MSDPVIRLTLLHNAILVITVVVGGCSGDTTKPDITPLEVASVEVIPASALLKFEGDTLTLTAVARASSSAIATGREFTWSSSDGGRAVGDIYAYTYALQDHEPDDAVEIVVLRNGRRLTFTAVLGDRR